MFVFLSWLSEPKEALVSCCCGTRMPSLQRTRMLVFFSSSTRCVLSLYNLHMAQQGAYSARQLCRLHLPVRSSTSLQALRQATAATQTRKTNSKPHTAERRPAYSTAPEVSVVPRQTGVTDGPWDAKDETAVQEAQQQENARPGRRQVGQPGLEPTFPNVPCMLSAHVTSLCRSVRIHHGRWPAESGHLVVNNLPSYRCPLTRS